MKVELNKENFNQAVVIVGKAVSLRPTTPVLNNLLLEALDGGIQITGTNLDTTIKTRVPAKTIRKGATTVPARTLIELLSGLKEEKLVIELDKETLVVTTPKVEVKIPTIAAEEFPTIEQTSKEKGTKIKRDEFVRALTESTSAASQDESRLVLTGVMFKPSKEGTTLVATDGYRLAIKDTRMKIKEEIVVAARDLSETAKIAASSDEEDVVINISGDNNQIGFSLGPTEYYTKLIAGEFPNYEQIIPKDFVSTAVVGKVSLLEALKVASTFAKDLGNVVHLTFDDKESFVSAASGTTGESKIKIDAKVTGQPINIAFNSRYITDGVGVLSGDEIEIKFAGPVNPALIKSSDDSSLIYIVMPVRTQT